MYVRNRETKSAYSLSIVVIVETTMGRSPVREKKRLFSHVRSEQRKQKVGVKDEWRASGVSYGWQVCRFVPYVDAGVIARTPDESDAVRVGMVFERAENGFGMLSSLVFPRGKRAPNRESLRNANTAPKTPPSSCTAGYLRVPDARSVHRFHTFKLANPPTESGSS